MWRTVPDPTGPASAGIVDFLAGFEVVVFDCDGVLLDANSLKVACMRAALSEFDAELVERFLAEFRETFGRSRREHFAALHRDYLRSSGDFEEFYGHYAGHYAKLLAERYDSAPLCANASGLVRALHARGVPLYVVTGTLSSEARQVLARKGLLADFQAVLGGERPKAERIETILRRTAAPRDRVILVGDARQDLAAARRTGVEFLFVERYAFFSLAELIGEDAGHRIYYVHDLAAEQVA
jgi:phosphoglycolate phosphatase